MDIKHKKINRNIAKAHIAQNFCCFYLYTINLVSKNKNSELNFCSVCQKCDEFECTGYVSNANSPVAMLNENNFFGTHGNNGVVVT